jgi:metal-responsive CopG/Arc/MetJ family transcriptional regulator
MPTNKPRYTIIVDDELLEKIDDFRFENRYPSRSAATLELIRRGMEALAQREKNKDKTV